MRLDLRTGVVTICVLLMAIFFVSRDQDSVYDIRPEPLLVEFVGVGSFDPLMPSSGGWYASSKVTQSENEGHLSGWMWPMKGNLRAYSSRPNLDRVLLRQIGGFRPDVELAKGGNSEFRFSGFDFKFDVVQYGQIECVVWTDGVSQDILWTKSQSKCNQR
jgi:hypothetical protein